MKWTAKKISIVVYIVSFVLPVLNITIIGEPKTMFGFHAFIMGATFIENLDIFFFCWLANIVYWLSLIAKGSFAYRLITSSFSVLLSLLLPVGFALEGEEGYVFYPGYFLWVVAFIINLIHILKTKNIKPAHAL